MSDVVEVNGVQASWGSISAKVDGDRYFGITEITFGDKLETVFAHGMARHQAPRGRSRGKYTTDEGKIKLFVGSAKALREALAAAGNGDSYGLTQFTLEVQIVEASSNEPPVDTVLFDCRLGAITNTFTEGNEALQEEYTFSCMRIERDGLTLYENVV